MNNKYIKWLLLVPFGMNIVTFGVLVVERMINICGLMIIYIAIYISYENYVY